jgi:hypothetical protein
MRKRAASLYIPAALLAVTSLALAVFMSCGSSNSPTQSSMSGTVTTTISDPPDCTPPNGNITEVWVTITKVTAHVNGDAGPNDSGWATLVDLTGGPMTIDLLSLSQQQPNCLLKTLGSATGLTPGKYQQIRVYLASNDNPVSGNPCATVSANNCVKSNDVLTALQLSSEAQTGIKIPPGQIGGGGINIQQGQSADVNINFMACESIVREGNGKFRLKPTLRANEVSLNGNTLSGMVIDASSQKPVSNAIVWLEQPSSSNIEDVVDTGTTDANGNFFFCPLPSGNYDVVITASNSVTYNATVTLAVPLGTALTNIPLHPETGTAVNPPASVAGVVTATSTSATTGTTADVALAALQAVGSGSPPPLARIPTFGSSTLNVSTTNPLPLSGSPNACNLSGTGSGCAPYTLNVPGSNPYIWTFATGTPNYQQLTTGPAIYWIYAVATQPPPAAAGTADCTPSALPATFDGTTQLSLSPGSANPAHNIAFTGCQ